MRIHAVIVNWNAAPLTVAAVRSVCDQVDEVVVVDNASADGSVSRLRDEFASSGRVRIIALPTNAGFAGGNNAGMRDALARGAEAVLWLNNDAEAEPRCVARLEQLLAGSPRAAAATPAVFNIDGTRLYHTTCSLDLETLRGSWEQGPLDGGPAPTGYVSAETALIRSTALLDGGLFDEDFFFFGEDLEWSVRMLRRGWELWCEPSARARHHWSGSSSGKVRGYFAARNRVLLLRKHGVGGRFAVARLSLLELRRLMFDRARRPSRWHEVPAVLTGWRDGFADDPRRRLP